MGDVKRRYQGSAKPSRRATWGQGSRVTSTEQPAGSLYLRTSKPLQLLPRRSAARTIARTTRTTRGLPLAQNIWQDRDLPANSLEPFGACPQPGLRHSSPEQRERKKTRFTKKGQKEEG